MSGNGDHEAGRLAVDFGDDDQILEDDRLQLLAGIGDLGLGQRDEAPIVRPGVVEQVEDDPRFLVEARLVDLAQADAAGALAGLRSAADPAAPAARGCRARSSSRSLALA
jgi:hypothetical protein